MKITCQSCQAKYTIADEKVAGKTVKIKCKKCGATIVVSGNDGAAVAAPVAAQAPYGGAPLGGGPSPMAAAPPGGDDDEGEGATRVFSEGAGGPGGDEWTVNITDDDQRTLTSPQIVMEFQRGTIKADTYAWKDGMADWLPISDIPELMRLVSVGSPRPAAGGMRPAAGMPAGTPVAQPAPVIAAAREPDPAAGLSGTMIMNEPVMSPYAAASPTAAAAAAGPTAARRNSAKMPAVDLFASGQHDRSPSAPLAMNSADRQLGERNENSVLFSISALTAAAGASKGGDDPFDLAGPSPPRRGGGGRGNVDDIMNLGGGMGGGMGGPMLAPPPLLAPVVEAPPPPPPQPVAAPMPMAQPMGPAMSAVPAMRADQFAPPAKSKAPLILGVVGLVVVLGGVGAFFATRGTPTSQAQPPAAAPDNAAPNGATVNTNAPANANTAQPQAQAAPTTPAPGDAKPADTGSPSTAAQPNGTPAPTNAGGPGPGKVAVGGPGPGPGKAAEPKPDPKPDPKAAEAKPDPKPADPPPAATSKPADPGGGGKEFDRAAAMSALSGASGAARGCKKDDGPTGTARVKVTFATSGSVTSASVDGPPFAGTAVGGCIAGAFRGAHVPPFDGSPVTVTKSISIN